MRKLAAALRVGHAPSMAYTFSYAGKFADGKILVSGNGTPPPAPPFTIRIHGRSYTVTESSTDIPSKPAAPNVFALRLEGVTSDGEVNALDLSSGEEFTVVRD